MRSTICALAITAVLALCNGEDEHEIKIVEGGVSGVGTTTRYWDCCKPTCAWPGNVEYKAPVKACKADGASKEDPENQSGCVGGQSYTCTNQGQWAVNENLAYGFVAARFVGVKRNMCCSCVQFSFKDPKLAHKKMVVQVTNTGNAPETGTNLFDIAMPGSGVGYYTKGCTSQWHTDVKTWGDQYGSVRTEAECNHLPKPLIAGCKFRFEWMKGVSNPPVSFVEVQCPAQILAHSGCHPVD